jgi:hypothetical protein
MTHIQKYSTTHEIIITIKLTVPKTATISATIRKREWLSKFAGDKFFFTKWSLQKIRSFVHVGGVVIVFQSVCH